MPDRTSTSAPGGTSLTTSVARHGPAALRAAIDAAAAAASRRSASITSGVRPVSTPGFSRKTVTVPIVISARKAKRTYTLRRVERRARGSSSGKLGIERFAARGGGVLV
jgi:hypothetical protein